jgi:hypothetical protein
MPSKELKMARRQAEAQDGLPFDVFHTHCRRDARNLILLLFHE